MAVRRPRAGARQCRGATSGNWCKLARLEAEESYWSEVASETVASADDGRRGGPLPCAHRSRGASSPRALLPPGRRRDRRREAASPPSTRRDSPPCSRGRPVRTSTAGSLSEHARPGADPEDEAPRHHYRRETHTPGTSTRPARPASESWAVSVGRQWRAAPGRGSGRTMPDWHSAGYPGERDRSSWLPVCSVEAQTSKSASSFAATDVLRAMAVRDSRERVEAIAESPSRSDRRRLPLRCCFRLFQHAVGTAQRRAAGKSLLPNSVRATEVAVQSRASLRREVKGQWKSVSHKWSRSHIRSSSGFVTRSVADPARFQS